MNVPMPLSAALDPTLTPKAKGILAWMYAKPKDYRPTISDICRENRVGEHSVRSTIKELEAAGYLELHINREESGIIKGTNWLLVGHYFDDKLLKEVKTL